MKITLRKRDSVTSAVLFLFNILGEYKNEYRIKLNSLLTLMGYFGKSEVAVRTGLSRMAKADILVNKRENNETVYELTEEGLNNIRLWNKGLARFFKRVGLRQEKWNQKWSLLSVVDFNKSNYENLFILEEFAECGLCEINNSLWITPYDIDDDITALLENRKLGYLNFMGTVESNLNLYDLLDRSYQIDSLRGKYIEFLDKIGKNGEKISGGEPGALLPILFETGWDFYDIATSDPMLPKELLSVWEGDRAASEFKANRDDLYRKIADFLEKENIF